MNVVVYKQKYNSGIDWVYTVYKGDKIIQSGSINYYTYPNKVLASKKILSELPPGDYEIIFKD